MVPNSGRGGGRVRSASLLLRFAAPLGTRGDVPSDLKTQEIKRSIGGVIYIYGFLARRSAPYMLGFSEDDFAVFLST